MRNKLFFSNESSGTVQSAQTIRSRSSVDKGKGLGEGFGSTFYPARPTKLNRPSLPGKFQKNQGVICQDNLNTR